MMTMFSQPLVDAFLLIGTALKHPLITRPGQPIIPWSKKCPQSSVIPIISAKIEFAIIPHLYNILHINIRPSVHSYGVTHSEGYDPPRVSAYGLLSIIKMHCNGGYELQMAFIRKRLIYYYCCLFPRHNNNPTFALVKDSGGVLWPSVSVWRQGRDTRTAAWALFVSDNRNKPDIDGFLHK